MKYVPRVDKMQNSSKLLIVNICCNFEKLNLGNLVCEDTDLLSLFILCKFHEAKSKSTLIKTERFVAGHFSLARQQQQSAQR